MKVTTKKLIKKTKESCFKPKIEEMSNLIEKSIKTFKMMENVVEINSKKCIVVGDLHGQKLDLIHILEKQGLPEDEKKYVFLGDYLNRGTQSIEVLKLLLTMVEEFGTDKVILLRGNHETEKIAQVYGFQEEVVKKYEEKEGKELFSRVMDLCNELPIAAVINKKIFAIHGGLSPYLEKIDDIKKINRRRKNLVENDKCLENPNYEGLKREEKLFVDLLWSDPRAEEKEEEFSESKRGAGVLFGSKVTENFCSKNGIKQIIRSHQLFMEGNKFNHSNKCLTIFSASNYCGKCQNRGAFAIIEGENVKVSETYFVNLSLEERIQNLKNLVCSKKVDEIDPEEFNHLEQEIKKECEEKLKLISEMKDLMKKK